MLKPEVQQALFDKYAPDATGAKWNVNRLIRRISTEPNAVGGHWLRKYLHVVCNDTIKTRFIDANISEFIVANSCWLFCGEAHTKLPNLKKGVQWHEVTDEMVDRFIGQLISTFQAHAAYEAVNTLAAINKDDASASHLDKVKECLGKVLPDALEAFEGLPSHIPVPDIIVSMKCRLIEHIANL